MLKVIFQMVQYKIKLQNEREHKKNIELKTK